MAVSYGNFAAYLRLPAIEQALFLGDRIEHWSDGEAHCFYLCSR
jgi:hypothetical protein